MPSMKKTPKTNIVTMLDAGEPRVSSYLAFELSRARPRRPARSKDEHEHGDVAAIARQSADALDYAHKPFLCPPRHKDQKYSCSTRRQGEDRRLPASPKMARPEHLSNMVG